jgi:hypothetical protein
MSFEKVKRRLANLETSSKSNRGSREPSAVELQQRILEAISDPFIWVTRHAKTVNEHWVEEGRPFPHEHFPPHDYIRHILDLLGEERVHWFEKSRDMMISWLCVAYLTLQAMKTPSRGVLFQTQKEDKVVGLIKYAKCLYKTQPEWLKEAFPLSKPIEKQADLELSFQNGSYIWGIPGGADQIRSFHPWGYLNDESSFQPEAGDCFNEALSVVKGKIIFNSSAGPSWYADARRDIIRNEEA